MANIVYLTAPHVCERYGVTSMTLHRWLRNEKMKFPKPMYLNNRRYFKVDDIESWERQRAVQG